ncbi:MAG: transposase [Clostridia bacterium]
MLDSSKLLTMIDNDNPEEQTAMKGYYQIVTSELDMEPLEVIDKYHGLTQIEDQFRVMKGQLETRPVFVRTPEHIEAHLLICMIALTILRILQKKVMAASAPQTANAPFWTYGLSGERFRFGRLKHHPKSSIGFATQIILTSN